MVDGLHSDDKVLISADRSKTQDSHHSNDSLNENDDDNLFSNDDERFLVQITRLHPSPEQSHMFNTTVHEPLHNESSSMPDLSVAQPGSLTTIQTDASLTSKHPVVMPHLTAATSITIVAAPPINNRSTIHGTQPESSPKSPQPPPSDSLDSDHSMPRPTITKSAPRRRKRQLLLETSNIKLDFDKDSLMDKDGDILPFVASKTMLSKNHLASIISTTTAAAACHGNAFRGQRKILSSARRSRAAWRSILGRNTSSLAGQFVKSSPKRTPLLQQQRPSSFNWSE